MLKFILQTDKPVAVDSPDYLVPHGTKLDNSKNQLFNKKLYALFGRKPLHVLDLGCSGGGFIKNCIDDGHIGIGLEGSDYSKKVGRAEWKTIPNNLFTCDITAEFSLKAVDETSRVQSEIKFEAITAWEFIEHIKTEDLPNVCQNVIRHLQKGGIWIMSVSPNEEVIDGMRLHQTVQNQEWWENFFHSVGFKNHPHLVSYFDEDWVRGPLQGTPGSFHLVLTYGEDEPPAPPSTAPYDGADLYQTGRMFFNQGITTCDASRSKINYGILCFDKALKLLPHKSDIHLARAVALLNLGNFVEAQAAASSVLELQPNHVTAHAVFAAAASRIAIASVSQSESESSDFSFPEHIILREINLIVFPDWSQSEVSLSSDLVPVIRTVLTHPEKSGIMLLIDTSDIAEEDANLILSGILMNFLFQEELVVDEEVGISLVGTLNQRQWERLLPHINLRIALAAENQQAIAQSGAANLPSSQAENLNLNLLLQDTVRSHQDNILTKVLSLPGDWHKDGTLTGEVLKAIFKYANQREILHSVETGCGLSTLLLSHLSQDHKVFALAEGDSMSAVCSSPLLNEANVEFIEGSTQKTLSYYKFENKLQLALIDGPHGYPFPDLEYYFIYPQLEENAILVLDDIHIPNLYNLFAFLKEDEMFELLEVVGTTAFFRRTNAPLLDPLEDGWWLQNYNKNRFPIQTFNPKKLDVPRSSPFPIALIDPNDVEVLQDLKFQESLQEVVGLTLLDICRLANLWQLCRMSNPKGNILEIGTYRGGAALHLSNSCPGRKIIVCDSFQGFESLDPKLDDKFDSTMFKDVSKESVESLFKQRQRNYQVIEGFFPKSCADRKLYPVSFVHLDVDIYQSTFESLQYLEHESILIDKSIIVLDDFHRNTGGVNKAVNEFTSTYKHWVALPIFPGQGILIHRTWLDN